MTNYGKSSRFKLTEAILVNGKETYGLWKPFSFTNLDELDEKDIMTIKVNGTQARRPDLIALKYYGSSLFEWVVIMSNKPQNPLGWPKANEIIRLPVPGLISGD